MNKIGSRISVLVTAAILLAGLSASAQQNQRQVRDLVRTLNSQIDNFQYSLESELSSTSADPQDQDDAMQGVRNLQDAVVNFEENFNGRRENRDDVQGVITAAQDVERFLRRQPQNQRIATEWNAVKNTISRLSANYGITPGWGGRVSSVPPARNPVPTRPNNYPTRSTASTSILSGTYRLDTARSENTDQILTETRLGGTQRQDLQQKLEAPQELAIDVRGNQVTLASSIATPVSFVADGRERSETDSSGRTVHVRATLRGQELVIASLGGESDYTITFSPMDGGRSLKVTRRITTEYLRQTVFADSVYEKTDSVAKLGIDSGAYTPSGTVPPYGNSPQVGPGRTGQYIVPNGTIVNAVLDNTIDTRASQNNDRFKMTVQSPMEYRGAVIEGYITGVGRSGRVSGRSNVTFNFESITLRDGTRYDFAGFLQAVKDHNGKPVKVDTEGTARGDSQTRETAKRGGIGAGIGAIIGAIAGGGKGAVIGAIIGGGAGAGSVVVQGREDIELLQGSTLTVQASSPVRDDRPPIDN